MEHSWYDEKHHSNHQKNNQRLRDEKEHVPLSL